MAELSNGMQVRLRNGGTCKVKKELGRGGQGIVYLVDYNGKDYALKWYIVQYPDSFYENLERNISKGAPTSSFLWPEALTERQNGSFGYLMKVRPSGYEEIGSFMLAKAKFASVEALLEACLQICTGFQQLHLNGYSYQDMNDGNFFINPKTGDVLICDNDNVAPNGINMGIAGKSGYMAPEIVDKVSMPNRYTDYFSLAVILFILIYLNRPFEGAKALSCPCLSENAEKILNGRNAVFIMDPSDRSNAPVRGVHTNVLNRWPLFPKLLREAFIKTFSKEAMLDPTKRVMDKTWQQILVQVRSEFVVCPFCGQKTFVVPGDQSVCIECGKTIPKVAFLKIGNNINIPLFPGQKIYKSHISLSDDFNTVSAEVIRNPQNPKLWGIRNLSGKQWTVTTPDGQQKLIDNNGAMPAIPGLKIRFSSEANGTII